MIKVNNVPVFLIFIGIWYLLFNLAYLPISPWQALIKYWPVMLVWSALKNLSLDLYQLSRKKSAVGSDIVFQIILLGLGLYLLAPRLGWNFVPISWNLLWPIILIIIGLLSLISEKQVVFRGSAGKNVKWKGSFVGSIHRGGTTWSLDDLSLWNGIGDIHLDLTQAIIPDREVKVEIAGLVGEVTIYVPANLPVKAYCTLKTGEISVFDNFKDGISRTLEWRSADYDEATRKLDLSVHLKFGEIKVRQIG